MSDAEAAQLSLYSKVQWPPVEPMRDKFGRYAGTIHDGTEKPWNTPRSRVTTVVGRLEDRYNIERWIWEKMAHGLGADTDEWWCSTCESRFSSWVKAQPHLAECAGPLWPHLYAILRGFLDVGSSKEIRNFMEQMAEAGGSTEAADRGTRYHELVAMELAGVKLPKDVTLEERRDIKAVLVLFAEHDIDVIDLERIVVSREMDYAGTLDYRLSVPGFSLPVIGDLKTGSRLDLSYGGYRVQLAAYAHASHEVADDGTLVDVTPCERGVGLLVHLIPGKGTAELVGVDLQAGWKSFKLAHRVWSYGRGRPRPISFHETMVLKAQQVAELEAERSAWVRARIDVLRSITAKVNNLTAVQYLKSLWPEGVPLPSQCVGWTGDSLGLVIAAVEITETDFIAPFPPNDPAYSR